MSLAKSTITDEQFVKVRCSTDARTHYFEATGAMYAQPMDDDEPLHLFDFLGVDISRCLKDEATSRWTLVSRKITLYLDTQTGEVLKSWQNPWTGEKLNVLHRSYDYQEFQVPQAIIAHIAPEISYISLDFNLKLPNQLASYPKYAEYSPEKYLRASDSYKFIFPTKMLDDVAVSSSTNRSVALSYYRMGPWEPWMKMKGKPGFLVLNYTGSKTDVFEELHPSIKEVIQERMPLFREAPLCRLDRSIATSWSRFEEQFDAYLRGEEFPLPAPIINEPCL
ncbi:DUF1838 family protein [Planktothrix sp. FACHB-1355]|uniref:DUF1838 family protein n=1 Tax=Aerosakkonema funiforme FACHB-1375 TaxID=2949571 RepID=A0A926ZGS4_9CYAN|nr:MULTISPECIES: DUF1838 family protein [Oscillatoriales]MBD2181447.1 DUF1838 family protein [Aerosakkonema funiforme FACHB-1375]MBD3563003.1 DUF1838 family protein [Planktothrix sp. FACHB-1355]